MIHSMTKELGAASKVTLGMFIGVHVEMGRPGRSTLAEDMIRQQTINAALSAISEANKQSNVDKTLDKDKDSWCTII